VALKNTAITVCYQAWDTTAGTAKTGDAANHTLRGVGDGSEFTPSSPSITEVDSTNLPGVYKASLTAGENNYNAVLLGGKSSTANVVITPVSWTNESTGDSYARLGAPANASVSADIAAVAGYIDTEVAAILAAVDTEVAAIKAKTDSLTFTSAGKVDANVLAMDGIVEGAYTLKEIIRGLAAACLGKASGLSTTTAVFRDTGDSKNRISATVDPDGNRTAVTLDLS